MLKIHRGTNATKQAIINEKWQYYFDRESTDG